MTLETPRFPRRRRTRSWLAATLPVALLGALGTPLFLPAAPAQAQNTPPVRSARTISLSFYNADAADVVRAISLQSGVNIAVAPGVRGRPVTIRVRNVPIEEALRLVAQAAGVSFRRTGNAYVVEEPRRGAGGRATTYLLQNLAPAAAKTLIEGALPNVLIQTAEGSPTVIITGTEQDLLEAQRLLKFSDVPAAAPPPTSATITPTNITAEALADVLRRAVTDATFEVRGNTLIVTGTREVVDRVGALLPTIDTPASAPRRVEVYEVRFSSAESLIAMLTAAVPGLQAVPSAQSYAPPPVSSAAGGGLAGGISGGGGGGGLGSTGGGISTGGTSGGGAGGAGGGTGSGTASKVRSLVLIGTDDSVDTGLRLLQATDVAPTQIEIEARIIDLSDSDTLNLGVSWNAATGTTIQEQDVRGGFRFGRFTRTPLTPFTAQLNHLETIGRVKTLANPRVSVLSDEEANIFIGEVRRFQILAGASATVGQLFTVAEVPVGITLLVRPRVNPNGEITMSVSPIVSTLTGLVDGLPQTASRQASTTLRIRDGETVVIGGLIRDDEIKNVQEVPLLAKIPIIGELFRNRSTDKRRSEVILFLTPRLLRDNGSPEAAAIEQGLPETLKAKPLIPGTRPAR